MTMRRGLTVLCGLLLLAAGLISGARELSSPRVIGGLDDGALAATTARATDSLTMDVVAARAVDRLLLFRSGNGSSSMRLSSDEVTALLTESLPGLLPTGVVNTSVHVRDGEVLLRADVITAAWSGAHRLRPVLVALPDTVSAELAGKIFRVGRSLVFEVASARAQLVPLPGSVVDALVRELPASFEAFNGPALRVSLPDGIVDVRIADDRFVLYATEPIVDHAVDG